MSYEVGAKISFKESQEEQGNKHCLYVPGTRIIFCKLLSSISILTIAPAS